MKILHIAHCYHPSQGGVQWYFKNVSERLVKDYGDEVTVVTTNSMYGPEKLTFKKIEPAEEWINGVKVIRFPFTRWHIRLIKLARKACRLLSIPVPDILHIWNFGPVSPTMKRYLMNDQSDVVCASSYNYSFMQLPLWKKTNFFYFGSLHVDGNDHALLHVHKKSIAASTMYIANTPYEKHWLINAGIVSSKIKVVGVGVNEKEFDISTIAIREHKQKLGIPPGAFVIGYIGRIAKPKNVQVLVNAFAALHHANADAYLIIAGADSDYVPELKRYIEGLDDKVKTNINWCLNFDEAEKPLLLHNMDVLVLPSYNESFGIVFLEAWACKKPVIGAGIGAVKDVIDDGVDGLLMKENTAEHLAGLLQSMKHNQSMRNSMGENGYKKVMENFTWDIITAKLRSCYTGKAIEKKETVTAV